MTYTKVSDIKARVKTDWSHFNHKFQPGDKAEVKANILPREWVGIDGEIKAGHSYVSARKQKRVGRVGEVVAVTCGLGDKVRGPSITGFCDRMYTRYYVQFRDGAIMGYDSHHLSPAFSYQR